MNDTCDKVQAHLMICSTLNDIYAKKNHDYGDSFAKLRNELPGAILVRIYDKYSIGRFLLWIQLRLRDNAGVNNRSE